MKTMTNPVVQLAKNSLAGIAVAAFAFFLVAGCATRGQASDDAEPQADAEPVRVATAASRPAASAPAAARAPSQGPAPGMNGNGDVIDSSKVEAGYGRKVKGLNDWEGEITGNPAPNSRFTRLQIGMPMRQVLDLVGRPTDQGGYITGKRFIPFYYGSDRRRYEMAYKGQGRLVFAGGAIGDRSPGHLIWIIHNPNDSGYR